jgi:hypothetical protein
MKEIQYMIEQSTLPQDLLDKENKIDGELDEIYK